MKFTSLLFLVFLGINFLSAQNLFLLENDSTGETFKIEEGLKVRVKTFGGDKYSGTLKIIDENTITVHGNTVSLDEIEKIKRHPFILTFLWSAITGYFAAGVLGVGLITAVLNQSGEIAALAVLGSAPLAYASISGVNILRSFKVKKGWQYSIQLN